MDGIGWDGMDRREIGMAGAFWRMHLLVERGWYSTLDRWVIILRFALAGLRLGRLGLNTSLKITEFYEKNPLHLMYDLTIFLLY
jgi:hypothetical protein